MGKTVLILGNGFDLAHDLPTRYSDFLDFCEMASLIYTCSEYLVLDEYIKKDSKCWEMNENIRGILFEAFANRTYRLKQENPSCDNEIITPNKDLDKLYNKIKENIWYKYFQKIYTAKQMRGENWIDFESEISYIIKIIDEYTPNITYSLDKIYIEIDEEKIEFPNKIKIFYSMLNRDNSIKEIRKILYNDLERLTQALEIYLSFIESISINVMSNDIDKYYHKCDHVVNFNYTHTYKSVYNKYTDTVYIHGEVNKKPNNMVLGIDEYWSEEERDSHTNFTIFKKFAQRIQKRTGIESYKWFDEIKSDYEKNNEVAEVFIFGHSLDVTDKDILHDYLENEATDVTIYCKDKETEGEYIANVIKIIGEKRLLEKVNRYHPKLKFIIQQPMVPIENKEDLSTSGAAT